MTGFTRRTLLGGIAALTAMQRVVGRHAQEGGAEVGPTLIEADSGADFEYPYFLYAPTRDDDDSRPILVQPNNTGFPTDDFAIHRERARETVEESSGREIADQLGAPFVVPVFPRPRSDPVSSDVLPQYFDRDALSIDDGPLERVDLQLIAMVEDARERLDREGYPVAEGLLLNGFSASGNFAERFASLHPEEVTAVTAGGINGMPLLPINRADGRELPYHVGVADVAELTGESFDREAFAEVNRFLYLGEIDVSDTIPFSDTFGSQLRKTALDVFGRNMQRDRFPYAKQVYEEVGANAVFRIYEGVPHRPEPAIDDIVAFYERTLAGEPIEEIRTDLRGNVPDLGAHVESDVVDPGIGEQIIFDGSRSSVGDGDITEYRWTIDGDRTATGSTVQHTFESAGGHAVRLEVSTADGETSETVEQVVVVDEESIEPTIEVSDQSLADRSLTIDRVATDRPALLRVRPSSGTSPRLLLDAGEERTDVTIDVTDRRGPGEEYTVTLVEQATRQGFERVTVSGEDLPNWTDGVEPTLIEADPDAGFEHPYFLYAPRRYDDENPGPVVVQPNNTGRPTDDFTQHREAAREAVDRSLGRTVADSFASPLIVPVFPRPLTGEVDGRYYTHQLDRDTLGIEEGPLERIDRQLLSMIEDARIRLDDRGYAVADGIVINGFSAAGNFANRFAALHADAVSSVTAGGVNGMPILPRESSKCRQLDYHVGVADLVELAGDTLDLEAYRDVDQLLYMGEFDNSDTIPFGDAFSEGLRDVALSVFGSHMTDDRFPYSRAVYDAFNVGSIFRTYPDFAHTSRPASGDVVRFHKASFAGADRETLQARFGGHTPNERAHIRFAPSRPATGEQVTFDATRSEIPGINAEPESYEWTFDDGTTATGPTAGHTFNLAGQHAVALTVEYTDGRTIQAIEFVPVGADLGQVRSGDVEGQSGGAPIEYNCETETPTETPATPTETPATPTSTSGREKTTGANGPGLGVTSAIGGLAATAYALLRRREQSEGDD